MKEIGRESEHHMINNTKAWISGVGLALLLGAAGQAQAGEISQITADDFYGSAYFKQAQDHPKIAKQKTEARKLKMVARDMRWKTKKLRAAIAKVDELGEDPIALAKSELKKGFEGAPKLKGKVLDVLINSEEPKHVVVYVRWRASTKKEVVKEASTIANVVATKVPLISTLSLSAIHPKAPNTSKKSVWQGKIGRDAMLRISARRIDTYADRLYGRLFEGVKATPF